MAKKFDVIFLDMDGVICDFIGSVYESMAYSLPRNWKETLTSYDLKKSMDANAYSCFWKSCETDRIFEKAKPYPWFRDLRELCENNAKEVVILTSAGFTPSFYEQKRRWINKYWNSAKVIMTSEKHLHEIKQESYSFLDELLSLIFNIGLNGFRIRISY